MNYRIFGQMKDSGQDIANVMEGQAYMEETMRLAFEKEQVIVSEQSEERIYEMMRPVFMQCNYEARMLEVAFPVQGWELNPMGTMHGGLMATAIDMACGLLVRFVRQSVSAVTVQLSVNFLRPVQVSDSFRVRVEIEKEGRRIIFLSAKLLSSDTQEIAATASGTFM